DCQVRESLPQLAESRSAALASPRGAARPDPRAGAGRLLATPSERADARRQIVDHGLARVTTRANACASPVTTPSIASLPIRTWGSAPIAARRARAVVAAALRSGGPTKGSGRAFQECRARRRGCGEPDC